MTEAPAEQYRVYTKEHDRVVRATDLVSDPAEADAAAEFLRNRKPLTQTHHASKHAHPARILLDLSGSMRGELIRSTCQALQGLGDRLQASGVPFEVLGFTTLGWKGGQSRKDWLNDGRPKNPGRLSDLLHVIFKTMEDDWEDSRDSIAVAMNAKLLKENIDGEAVEWAMSRAKSDPDEAVLVMISDGVPWCNATLGFNPSGILADHMAATMQGLQDDGVAFRRVCLDGAPGKEHLRGPAGRDVFVDLQEGWNGQAIFDALTTAVDGAQAELQEKLSPDAESSQTLCP